MKYTKKITLAFMIIMLVMAMTGCKKSFNPLADLGLVSEQPEDRQGDAVKQLQQVAQTKQSTSVAVKKATPVVLDTSVNPDCKDCAALWPESLEESPVIMGRPSELAGPFSGIFSSMAPDDWYMRAFDLEDDDHVTYNCIQGLYPQIRPGAPVALLDKMVKERKLSKHFKEDNLYYALLKDIEYLNGIWAVAPSVRYQVTAKDGVIVRLKVSNEFRILGYSEKTGQLVKDSLQKKISIFMPKGLRGRLAERKRYYTSSTEKSLTRKTLAESYMEGQLPAELAYSALVAVTNAKLQGE